MIKDEPFKPVRNNKEYRTKRAELLLSPSLHKQLTEIAKTYQLSFNELVNQVLTNFVEREESNE